MENPNEAQLKIIAKRMLEQDNRATQFPLYMIQEDVEVIVNTDHEDPTHYHLQNNEYDDYFMTAEEYEALPDNQKYDGESSFTPVKFVRKLSDRTGPFLTEEGAKAHILANDYHYRNPTVYVISAWRNPEMQLVMSHLISLVSDTIPGHYL